MPPHCDSMDGPVVSAARRALDESDVRLILPFVPVSAEQEAKVAFARAQRARDSGPEAREVADLYFFETVVRLHRAGEGAPYTGLKPAGLDVGPAIPLAEKAIQTGSSSELYAFLSAELRAQLDSRLRRIEGLRPEGNSSIAATRTYVEGLLDFEVFSHHLYEAMHRAHH